MNKPTAIDAFHRHEVLHMAHVIASMFEEYVEQHTFTQSDPELAEASGEIGERLRVFYQLVGSKMP